ncbi:MAG TPA: hypothetical protein VN894_15660 [Polyangiaceae bacterium]|nr:hypothetical protein [Polyangiaceae bacterium]
MRVPRSIPFAAAACASLMGLAAPAAWAQSDADRATARTLGVDGQQALENKDYKSAEDRYRRAETLVHAPTLMIGLARALAGLGRFVEAQETYNRIIREGVSPGAPEVFKKAVNDAKREVEGVGAKIGGVTITVHAAGGADVPNAKVVLDGSPVSTASLGVRRSIDPGSHVLQVSGDGFKAAELHFDVTSGGSLDQPVTLEADRSATLPAASETALSGAQAGSSPPAADQASSSSSGGGARGVLPWVALGIGGAGLGVGGVTGLLAMGQHSDLTNTCHGTICPSSAQSDIDSYHTMALVSTIGFIVGSVGVATGAILLLTQPKAEGASLAQAPPPPRAHLRVVPVIGFGSIGAVGEF